MNKFKENLKVEVGNMQDIPVSNNKSIDEIIADVFVESTTQLYTGNQEEQLRVLEMQMNITRIIENYEELRPIMTKFFEMKRKERERER